jgi:hypothetical protein
VPADVGQEELQAVAGAGDLRRLGGSVGLGLGLLGLGCGGGLRLAYLEADALELAGDLLDLLIGEVMLDRERLELSRLDEAALLGALHKKARLIALEQFVQLVLRQVSFASFQVCGVVRP